MRVGLLIDHWHHERGGAERALAAFVEFLVARGDEVHVFGLSAKGGSPGRFHRVPVRTLPRGALERELAKRSIEAAREVGCDVTIAIRHVEDVDVYWPHGGLHACTLRSSERSRGRVSTTGSMLMHLLSPKHKEFLALEKEVLGGGAQVVWCVSELVRHEIIAAHPEAAERLEVHPNGVSLQHFKPELRGMLRGSVLLEMDIPLKARVLLFLGGNWRLKGWNTLVAALKKLPGEDWHVLAAGDKPMEAMRTVKRAGLDQRVRVVPPRDARGLFAAADLMVQPTWRDPCSLATLEALACGVPVVTTTENGAADAFGAGGAGSVVPPGDAKALADAIRWRFDGFDEPNGLETARAAARVAAEGRDRGAWLGGLAESLDRVAASRSAG